MKTGIELIAKERQEQLSKHGYTSVTDADYTNGELLVAAKAAISGNRADVPASWAESNFAYKMPMKSEAERLAIAGALIAAEIDRLQAIDFEKYFDQQTG